MKKFATAPRSDVPVRTPLPVRSRQRVSTPRYVYDALSEPEMIRILLLEAGSIHEQIRCKLIHVSLNKPPEYSGLSYVWGDPEDQELIFVDGKTLSVTANLGTCLRHIRSPEEEMALWVDAVCINQEDHDERGSQVRHMKQIYERSHQVLAWLGEEDEDFATAFRKMREIRNYYDEKRGTSTDITAVGKQIQRTDNVFFGNSPADLEVWQAMSRFCQKPWWSRAWILQESTTTVPTFLVAGHDFIPYFLIVLTVKFMSFILRYHNSSPLQQIGIKSQLPLVHSTFRSDRRLGKNLSFLRILMLLEAYQATDPRDKVYTAVGLASDLEVDDIPVDYNLSVAQVYTNVAHHFLKKTGSLDWLGLLNRSWLGICPSWVPDWTQQRVTYPLPKEMAGQRTSKQPVYCACGKTERAEQTKTSPATIEGDQLITTGFVLDEIDDLRGAVVSHLGDVRVEQSWIPQVLEELYSPTGEKMDLAFMRTIVGDVIGSGSSVVSRASNVEWPSVADKRDLEARTALSSLLPGTPPVSDMKSITRGRRLAFTKERKYMGVVPYTTQVGDLVCILQGLQVPCILRRKPPSTPPDESFTFMGECYMHGIMDGEALEPTRTGLFQSQPKMGRIVLR